MNPVYVPLDVLTVMSGGGEGGEGGGGGGGVLSCTLVLLLSCAIADNVSKSKAARMKTCIAATRSDTRANVF